MSGASWWVPGQGESPDPQQLLPVGVTLVRASNPGPMTLDGTNTYLIHGPDGVVVVDPGPADADHLALVIERASWDADLSGNIALIVLTHGHPDHSDGVPELHRLTGAPVMAVDQQWCRGGATPPVAGLSTLRVAGLTLKAIATPGHTSDSMCLLMTPYQRPLAPGDTSGGQQVLLTGDTILGRGSTVVAYPDGHLGDYLTSLALLARLESGVRVLPGHGPVLDDAAKAAEQYLDHRADRLRQIQRALANGATSPADVVATVYADVDRRLWPAALLSVEAQLAYLREQPGPSG